VGSHCGKINHKGDKREGAGHFCQMLWSNAVQLRGEERINSPARWPTPEEIFLVKSVLFPKKLLSCVGGEVKNKDLVFIN